MIFYPKIYLKNVKQIPISLLKKNKIKGIIMKI